MKTRSPFLTLVKFELLRLWHNCGSAWWYAMWVLGFAFGLMPSFLQIAGRWAESPEDGDTFSVLTGVWEIGWMFSWLFLLGFQCSFALLREARSVFPLSTVPDDHVDEFSGTRAVNPRILFRAKTLVLALVIIAPLLVNVAVSLLVTESIPVLRSRDFAVWLIWAAVAAITVVQGCYGLISKLLVKRNRRLAAFVAALVPSASMVAIPLCVASEPELFQEPFIFFAEHWLPLTLALGVLAFLVQRFCERRFAEQEVL